MLSSNTFDTHAVLGFLVAGAENLMLVWLCAQIEGRLNPFHSPVYVRGTHGNCADSFGFNSFPHTSNVPVVP